MKRKKIIEKYKEFYCIDEVAEMHMHDIDFAESLFKKKPDVITSEVRDGVKKVFMIDMDELDVVAVSVYEADWMDAERLYFQDENGETGLVERAEVYDELEDALSICESYCRDMSAFYVKKGDLIADRLEGLSSEPLRSDSLSRERL